MEDKTVFLIYTGFIIIMSIITFTMYGIDKRKAKKAKWRIRESTLISLGITGGAAGGLFGMHHFRHKTKHPQFWISNIFGVILHCILGVWIFIST